MNGIFDVAHHHLQQHLTPSRYAHSVGVMHIMADLAEIYSLNREQALLAGLLHDIAKDTHANELLASANKVAISLFPTMMRHPMYLHGPVGAHFVQHFLGINDPNVLTAIHTHTTHENITGANQHLCWCLRFADILAPVVSWPGQQKLYRTVYAGHFEQAQLLLSRWVIEYFEQANIPVHPNFTRNAATFAAQLNMSEDFYKREM